MRGLWFGCGSGGIAQVEPSTNTKLPTRQKRTSLKATLGEKVRVQGVLAISTKDTNVQSHAAWLRIMHLQELTH